MGSPSSSAPCSKTPTPKPKAVTPRLVITPVSSSDSKSFPVSINETQATLPTPMPSSVPIPAQLSPHRDANKAFLLPQGATVPVSPPARSMCSTPISTFSVGADNIAGCGGSASKRGNSNQITNNVMAGIVRSSSAVVTPSSSVELHRPSSNAGSDPASAMVVGAEPAATTPARRTQAIEALQRAVSNVKKSFHDVLPSYDHHSGEEALDESQAGNRMADLVRSVMHAADTIDDEGGNSSLDDESSVDAKSTDPLGQRQRKTDDWRDDNDSIVSSTSFFHSAATLEKASNRVLDTIIAAGHAAQTDEEMRWLFRNSALVSLLDEEDLNRLIARSLRREFTDGEVILDIDAPVQHFYLVVWGEVVVFRVDTVDSERRKLDRTFRSTVHQTLTSHRDSVATARRSGAVSLSMMTPTEEDFDDPANAGYEDDSINSHIASVQPGQVFGVEGCIFGAASRQLFRAGNSSGKTILCLIPYEDIREVLARNPRFAQGVGATITGSVDVFGPIRQFCRFVFSPTSAQNEYLPLWSILESYTRIQNVIHTKLFSKHLDTGAWGYAINRLPENLTSTFCFDLVHALPPFVASRMRVESRAADVRKSTENTAASVRTTRTAISYIRTKERRRCTWHLGMEGKTLVLLRDGFTDLLDFLTMLCVHIMESNKLRGRVQGMVHPPAIDILDEYLRKREAEELEGKYLVADGVSREEEMKRVESILARMPLTREEQSGLLRNWGHNTLLRIYEIMMHREEYNVRVDPSISRKFQTSPFHEWALNLRGCVLEKLGLGRFAALPDNLHVDVVSSNTHCIKNLLCSFCRKYREEILDYVQRKESKRLGRREEWHNVDDMVYAALTGFLQHERPDLKDEYTRNLEESGITVLQDTAMTGLQVDVIPVHRLNYAMIDETIHQSLRAYYEEVVMTDDGDAESGTSFSKIPTWAQVCKPLWRRSSCGSVNKFVTCSAPPEHQNDVPNDSSLTDYSSPSSSAPVRAVNGRLQHHFLINMDFAFGAQAEGICRAIFSAFGKRVRSVSVMGKAGGLQGKRGDIQLASHVLLSKSSLILEDNQDELRNCRNQDLTAQRLGELAGPRVAVHEGKVLTVTGTMLQNTHLLRYYQQVWRCIGTEMEGSYFARVIEDFYRQGIAHPHLTSRFAYYTSDLPLAQSDAENEARRTHRAPASASTLSAPMTPQEGVPPLYAIARGILENILL